ncbi:protein of unknown function [Candidatus Methylocalor cossyra]|uniref:Uncharacterized protein n=1 Tax=Candidatus Methylocalor cossyra TaxID=3108543 RepID=A0ABM9NE34_9GAMM
MTRKPSAPQSLATHPPLWWSQEDRTPDLLRARQALSQLSYGPAITDPAAALVGGSGRT